MKPRITNLNDIKKSNTVKGMHVYEVYYLDKHGVQQYSKVYSKDAESAIKQVKYNIIYPSLYSMVAMALVLLVIIVISGGALLLYNLLN